MLPIGLDPWAICDLPSPLSLSLHSLVLLVTERVLGLLMYCKDMVVTIKMGSEWGLLLRCLSWPTLEKVGKSSQGWVEVKLMLMSDGLRGW